uniref:Conserved plasma membrane protein n=1 Tax=Macrostomum lignano TaxID=282301 RepID=A0A1I8FLK8_9PLAT
APTPSVGQNGACGLRMHRPIGRSVPLRCRQFKRPGQRCVSVSTRQRPCRCLAVKQQQQQQQTDWSEDCRAAALATSPPALQHYLAVNCAWCNWDSWQGRRYPLPGSPGGSRDSSGRETGAVGRLDFRFPDVFKAVFVLVALVIALISCRGLCILVQNRFGDFRQLGQHLPARPGRGHRRRRSRPFRDGDEEASGADGELTPAVVQLENSANLGSKRSESSSRGSYPDPFTSSHPLSVVYEPVDEAARLSLDSDEAFSTTRRHKSEIAEPSTAA